MAKTASRMLFMAGGALFLLFNVTVYNIGASVQSETYEAENPSDPLKKDNFIIVGKKQPGSRYFKTGYKPLASISRIHRQRYVRFSAPVSIYSLLEDGEELPSEKFRGVFAKARAAIYARKECERLMQDLASRCEVGSVTGRLKGDYVNIHANLYFVQEAELGTLDRAKKWSFDTLDTRSDSDLETTLDYAEDERLAIYRQVVEECESIKERQGNCAITRVNIRTNRRRGEEYVKISFTADYAFLTETE